MSAPIGVQLYTIREALAEDFIGVIEKIAEIGYAGVETAGFPPDMTPKAAKDLFDILGLSVTSAHVPLPLGEKKGQVLELMAALECNHMVNPAMKPEFYESVDGIKRVAEMFNEANAVAAANGMRFSIHNHWWEFGLVGERYAYQILQDYLDPAILFEVDTYWVKTAGVDPTAVVSEMGARAPLLHIKDGPALKGKPQVAVGEGVMDFHRIIPAGGKNTEWLIVELDACATDMIQAVKRSYDYLVREGLAQSNRAL